MILHLLDKQLIKIHFYINFLYLFIFEDDLLKKLWKNQFFQDELSKFLDWEHRSHINNHRHLAEVFHIPEEVRDSISNSQMISRSEKLLDDIQTKYPKLTIKDLCEYFSLETWHLIQNAAVPGLILV